MTAGSSAGAAGPEPVAVPWRLVIAGAVAVLVGLGFARFSYPPLVPGMIEAGWFSAPQTAYLGAANLAGYLLGALSASLLAARIGVGASMRLALVVVALSFLLCARPGPFVWFFAWRLLAGWAGAVLMVVGPSTVLSLTPVWHRPMVGACVFSGIGLGILAALAVIPWLLTLGVGWAWLSLGLISLLLSLASWRRWSSRRVTPPSVPLAGGAAGIPVAAFLVILAYSLDAFGFVPHTLFWVDFIAREQGFGMGVASVQWALFAIGAICGPFLAGWLASRAGWFRALLAVALVKVVAMFLSAVPGNLVLISLCSLLAGAMAPALVSLTSGYLASLVAAGSHRRVWGWATAAFALSQAVAGQGMAALYAHLGGYPPLFVAGGIALLGGAVTVLLTRLVRPEAGP